METSPAELLQFHASLIVHKYNSDQATTAEPGTYLDDDDELVASLWHKIYTTVQRRFAGHIGTVTKVHSNGTYDIVYANGETEQRDRPPDHAGHSRKKGGRPQAARPCPT